VSKKSKRYFFSVVEEMIMNPKFNGFRAGRIEVYDNQSKSPYAMEEYRFMIPEEFYYEFREIFDFKESDLPIEIKWDMFDIKEIYNKYYGD
jgi:hypothetical protein